MIDEEYKENVEYIRSTIMPKLQKIQRDLAESLPGVSLTVWLDGETGSMSAHAAVFDDTCKVTDSCTANFFMWITRKKLTMNTTSSQNFSRSTQSEK